MVKHRREVSNINKKKMLFPVMALAVLAGGLLTVGNAFAQDSVNHDSVVQKIADKFGLNKDEVQKVFDEERIARQTEMQAKNTQRLDQLVKDGKITEAQESLILNKQKELQAQRQANRGSFKDKTSNEIKTQMETERTTLETWAKENGINMEYFHPAMGDMRGHHEFETK